MSKQIDNPKTGEVSQSDSEAVGYAEGEIARRFIVIEEELQSMKHALTKKNIPDTISFAGLAIREIKRILELITSV